MMTSREIYDLLRDVFASLRDAVFVVDPHTRMITDCNPSLERIFGYRRDEIIGRTMEFLQKEGRLVGREQSVSQVLDDGGECVAIVVVVSDITDRKSTEDALERDRVELKAIYEHVPVLMCTLDENRRVLHANKAFTEFTGVPESELLEGRACGVFGCINAIDDPRGCGFGPKCQDCQLRLAIEDTLKTGREHRDVEYRATLEHHGARRDVVLLGSTVRVVAAGHPNLLLCLQDITLRVQAEDALKQSEAELADAQTLARIGSWRVVLEQGVPVWSASEELYRIYDYPPDMRMTTETGFDRIHPDDRERVRAIWSTTLLGQNPTEWEHRIVVDGRVKWIHVRAHSRFDENGRLMEVTGTNQDITEWKEAEEQLEFQVQVLDQIQDTIIVTDLEGHITFANRAACDAIGLTPESVIGNTVHVFGEDSARGATQNEIIQATRAAGQWRGIVINRSVDGSEKSMDLRTRLVCDVQGNPTAMCGIGTDMTERIRAEEDLRHSEGRYRELVENLNDVIYAVQTDGTISYVSSVVQSIFGYTPAELIGKPYSTLIHPDDLDRIRLTFADILEDRLYPSEYRMWAKDGGVRWVHSSSRPIREGGRVIGLQGRLTDITELKLTEEALRESEERFRRLSQGSFEGIVIHDEGKIVDANEAFVAMFGNDLSELIGKNALDFATPELREIAERHMRTASEEPYEGVALRKDGSTFDVEVRGKNIPYEGRMLRVTALLDITERKRVEEALKKSTQVLRETGEMAKVGGWELDLSTKEVLWTEEVCRIHGFEPGYTPKLEEAMSFYAPESKPVLEAVLKKAMETGEPYDIESLFIPSGSKDKIWVRSLGKAVYSGDKIVKLVGTFQNIDRYMRIREALRESEEKFRMLFETLVHGVVLQNAEGHIISANHAAEQILGLTHDQMLGRKSQDPRWRAIHEDGSDFPGDTHPAMVALRTGKEVRNVIMGVSRFSNNEYVWININAIPQFRPGNTKPHQVFATFEDITERKKAETALAQSEQKLKDSHIKLRSLAEHLLHTREQERRNIAQEIHDELGQVLTALKMDLRWMEKRLEPSQNRFQQKLREMIGLTDQTIEKVQRLSSQLRPRMLDDLGLTAAIEWLGADFSRRTRIRCKVTVELTESRIGGNSTTVIFRMVQEALTNVERHARASTAVVELREVQERIEIRVQDNGVGIAEGQADGPKSFGLIGIKERAQGLDGEVSIRGEPGKGTTVAISIPYPGGGALA